MRDYIGFTFFKNQIFIGLKIQILRHARGKTVGYAAIKFPYMVKCE